MVRNSLTHPIECTQDNYTARVQLGGGSSNSGFPDRLASKESSCDAGDPGSIPGSGRSPGEGIGYPLQYSWASLLVVQLGRIRLQCGRPGFDPWVGNIPWRRAW